MSQERAGCSIEIFGELTEEQPGAPNKLPRGVESAFLGEDGVWDWKEDDGG